MVDRRFVLGRASRGLGAAALARLGGASLGGIAAAIPLAVSTATPATAVSGRVDPALDIQILQTASSLETLLVDLYGAALGTGPLGKNAPSALAIAAMPDIAARDTLVKLLTDTQAQHREHRLAFQSLTTGLGGKQQDDPNPKYASGAVAADVGDPLRLVDYAAVLEKIATDTYVVDIGLAGNVKAKEALAAVLGVEAQHVAVFRMIGALLRADTSQLVRIPIGNGLPDLPPALAALAFPQAMDDVTSSSAVAEPGSGAVA
jgi:hypothetical protein